MGMEDAKVFLSRVLPWPPVGDANAYFNVHWSFMADGYVKKAWSGRACQSVDEMIKACEFAKKGKGTLDIYFCTSSQRMADQKQSKGGFAYKAAIRNQPGVVELRSLFIDIDVKEGAYATPADALKALIEFLRATNLPKPTMIVSSGTGGLHVYWVLDVALTRDEWQPYANALAEATRRHGLKTDAGCTIDSARILRVPDTENKKITPHGNVKLLKGVQPLDIPLPDMDLALQPYMVDAAAVEHGITPTGKALPLSELSAGIIREAKPVILEDIKSQCGFIREALDTGGAAFDYPQWNVATMIATFTEDGRANAHAMASGHAGYTYQATEALFEEKVRVKAERNMGWPKCASVQNAGCSHCATCPIFALGKSPLNLGKTAPSPFVPEVDLPPSYSRSQSQMILRMNQDEKGEITQHLVSPYPMFGAWVQSSPWTLHFVTRLEHDPKDVPISITMSDINSDGMMKRFGSQGMGVKRRDSQQLQEFLVSWIKTLQGIKGRVVTASPFGWYHEKGKLSGFCYAGQVWSKEPPRPAAAPDPVHERRYTPVGNLADWKAASNLITSQGRPDLDVILALSFGAPLLMFTGHEGCLTSAYSTDSGIGKSTTMKVAQAVWGHPVQGVQGMDDTVNSVLQKIGTTKNLPLFWDELKTEQEVDKFVTFAFKLSGGKEKSRLSSDGSQRELGSWQTIVVAASNDSLVDSISRKTKSTTAGVYRVLEFTVAPPDPNAPKIPAGVMSRTVGELNNNFGQAGLVFAQYLGEHYESVRDMVAKLQDALNVKLSARNDERFWIANVTCAVAGATLSNKLGLTNIDIRAMTNFLLAVIESMRKTIRSSPADMRSSLTVSTIMQQFWSHIRRRHLLIVQKTTIGKALKGRPRLGGVQHLGDVSQIDGVFAQAAMEDAVMHISRNYFREWLGKNQYSPNIVITALQQQWGAREIVGTLGAGTVFSAFPEPLLEIDLGTGPGKAFTESLAYLARAEPDKEELDEDAAVVTGKTVVDVLVDEIVAGGEDADPRGVEA